VKIITKNLQSKVPVNPRRVRKTVQKVLSSEGVKKSGEITVCFVNDKKIKELNLKYLGRNASTDVIAFNITDPEDKKNIFADIAISTDAAIDNAKIFHTNPLFELYLYVIHGALHILGYDDQSKKDKLVMRKKEDYLMKVLDLSH
jgi:probable rRNA maturation factor